jgi:uncharacterized protein
MIYFAFIFFTLTVLVVGFYQWQYFMVFSPTYYRGEELDEDFQLLSLTTADGVELEGVVYEPKDIYRKLPTIDSTILFFAGRSHDSVGLIKKLSLMFPHARIITFNYRSYGKSEGVVSEKNILSDGLEIAQVVQKNYGDFYLVGFSIGSIVASYIASKQKVLGLFLIGTFDSIKLMAKEKFGSFLSQFVRYNFNHIEMVKDIDAKTYIFVSKDDETTYIKNARNLKNHVKNLTHYIELENLSHKEILWDDEVIDKINQTIQND